jgi:diguanylate cyclase (GGDEF)-like protein
MIFAGAALGVHAAVVHLKGVNFPQGGWSPGILSGTAPMAACAALFLLTGVLLLAVRAYLSSSEKAARLLTEAVRLHGEDLPENPGFRATADAARRRLDRYRADIGVMAAKANVEQEQRIREITDAHKDLLTRHMFTKKMLQSRRPNEVFEILLRGVREGLGFPRTVIGVLDERGDIVFGTTGNGDGSSVTRIPCWDEGSIIARTTWKGNAVVLPSPEDQKNCREDRAILGEGPSFLVPVTRKPGRKCSEIKACGHNECPAFHHADAKCWIEGFSTCRSHDSDIPEEMRKECARCEMFATSAILVVRSHPPSRTISRETTDSIVTLAYDAAVALELVELHETTKKMAITDGLTEIANHREFYQSLRRELARARRYGHGVSLLMLDVDDFKKFNDNYGHLAGDSALKKIARVLQKCVRKNDIVARYGGEEFGIILPETTPAGALMFAERIKTEIANRNFLETSGEAGHLTVSIGIYSTFQGNESEERMVKFADEATYIAKNMGKNRVVMKDHA